MDLWEQREVAAGGIITDGILKSMESCPWTWILTSDINRGPCFPRTMLVVFGLFISYASITHQAHIAYKVKKRLENFAPQDSTKNSLANHFICISIMSMTIDYVVILVHWVIYLTLYQHLSTESLNKKKLSDEGSTLEAFLTCFQNIFLLVWVTGFWHKVDCHGLFRKKHTDASCGKSPSSRCTHIKQSAL